MTEVEVLVLGGGLAGLSTAYHLLEAGHRSVLVLERLSRPGGLAGSETVRGFTFDHTGHLLHLHDPYGQRLILGLLGANVRLVQRDSWVYSHGVFTRYPFQANTFGLPAPVVEDCVVGLLKAARADLPFEQRERQGTPSFIEWCRQTFGEGITRHFMAPYNAKLWRVPLERMTTEWAAPFVPRPKVQEVLYGALTDQKKFFGYNASFRYPLRGGSQALPDALAARVGEVLALGCPVERVDLAARTALAANLGPIRFRRLVNTLPLPRFVDLCDGLPAEVRRARRGLRWTSVHCLNLGIGRAGVSAKHWVYFPERRFPFYRAGFYSNFSPHLAPPGASSLYVEHSARPGEPFDGRRALGRAVDGLRNCGLLRRSDPVVLAEWRKIPTAYVTYDRHRARVLPMIFERLARLGVESIGRYGAWKYSFMEEAVLDGRRCAARLLGRASSAPGGPSEELKPLK